jgi:Glycosyl hydrolase 109, C-terminal domain/Oxidoreductase family, NAD-binding Rossmann fold
MGMTESTSRRNFLAGLAGAGVGLLAARRGLALGRGGRSAADYRPPTGFAAPPMERVRMGFVGVGLQGGSHVRNFLRLPNVEVRALCDIDGPRAAEVGHWVVEAGQPAPDLFTRGEEDFRRLCERDDLDLVFTATPWRWHVPVCLEAMNTGKHAATEVPAAYRLDDCWELVETAERTLRHCVMMENCNYGRSELMVLNMVRRGLFGEITHGEGAYIHDLRAVKFSDANEGLWRLAHSVTRNGNLYPTHGLGPVARYMNINRGDRFDYMVSMSSNARGLALYAQEHMPDIDPRRRAYALGDMNTSLIKTRRGRTIMLQHDTTTPRPYSRLNLIQGTRGCFAGYPDRIHIEGRSPEGEWEDAAVYREEFEHPLWRRLGGEAESGDAGHGGMDYIEDRRLIECLLAGEPTDSDVYDAAALSAVIEVSEKSVASEAKSIEVPDFTRGGWERNQPAEITA